MCHRYGKRKETIQKIKKDIERTEANVDAANDMLETIDDSEIREKIQKQNEQRLEAIDSKVKDVNSRITD